MLTNSSLKFIAVPLFILNVVICIETSSVEVFDLKDEVPMPGIVLSRVGLYCDFV
jgi:hypothetical protein